MKKLLAFLPLLFLACAQTPYYLDATRLALTQDSVIAGWLPPAAVAPFRPLVEAQRAFTATNLTVRQDGIEGRWPEAIAGYKSLIQNGYFSEGFSYGLYTNAVFEWRGYKPPDLIKAYARLAAQDGALPLPEVSDIRIPHDTDSLYVDASYFVKRSGDSSYIIIGVSTDLSPFKDLHFHPAGFAVYRRGKWLARPVPYTAFSLSRAFADESTWNTVPAGVFGPAWRLAPPSIKLLQESAGKISLFYIPQKGKPVLREYLISADTLEVLDNGKRVFKG